MNEFHDGEGLEPIVPEPIDSEELEVLRSWSDRLEALRAEEVEISAEVEPEPEPEPELQFEPEPQLESQPLPVAETEQRTDEDDVLESWSDRLEAFRASEPEIVPESAPTQVLATPPVAAPAPPARERAKPARSSRGHRRLVGLKIGASQIAAATVTNNGSAEVVQLAREPLGPGIVVAGEVREPVLLGEALKAFFKKHKLPRKDVRLGVAANRIGVRTFDLPDVSDPHQRENAILFRAQEVLPIPVNEAVLDYHILDAEFGEEKPRVLLVVAYRDLVDGFVQACEIAEVTLTGIDLEAFALLRALGAPPEDGEPRTAAHVAVSIGHHRSTVAVSSGHICEFTRVVDWGGDKLDIAIARTLGITPQEAVPLKHSLSLIRSPGISAEEQAVVDAVVGEVHSFTRDLVSSLHYYQSQPGALEIADIALTGGTAHLPGLAEELQRLIGVDVHVADPFGRVRLSKKVEVDETEIGSLTIAIGLGIED
jgi:type IV pilus assembly protein PilM